MFFLRYKPHSHFEQGIFVPYLTVVEAERQAANDLLTCPGDYIESIVEADYDLTSDAHLRKHEVVRTASRIRDLAPKHLEDLKRERQKGEVAAVEEYHRRVLEGKVFEGAVPGLAYTICSGGTATGGSIALVAATAKTVIGLAAGANSPPSITEVAISFDGVTASAVPVLCEWVSGTNATNPPGTNSTSATPKQVRGWPSAAAVSTAAYAWSAEPTVLEVFKKRLLTPNGGLLVLQSPLSRESGALVTASTQFKFVGLRLTSPAGVNCHIDVEFEE